MHGALAAEVHFWDGNEYAWWREQVPRHQTARHLWFYGAEGVFRLPLADLARRL